MKIISEMSCAQ